MRNRCAIPQENNPAADETGKNCDQKQSGSVWFLASTKGCTAEWEWYDICRKECSLWVPINVECSYVEFPNLKTDGVRITHMR
jgi:hypothetical protein